MKYVIIDHDELELPIIFDDIIKHDTFKHLRPISAGEVRIYGADGPLPNACCCENAIRVSVSGRSVTLGLPSRPEDALIIANNIMRHYN
jgi:hypothetical protein